MDGQLETSNRDGSSKRKPFEDLSKEELILKCKGLLTIAQKAKQAKLELINEVEEYKAKFEKSENEKKSTTESFQTLQELVDSLTEQKLNYITEVDSAKSKIKALNIKCEQYDEEIKRHQADLILKETTIKEITEKLSYFDCEIISLKRQNNRLLEENEQVLNQLSEMETKTAEFNTIGLHQQKQLKMLEETVQKDEDYKTKIDELNSQIKELEIKLDKESTRYVTEYEAKLKDITSACEHEKSQKEKLNVKLRSYKDKILKCAACINQLKNSRFILAKTVKEYSENIPKWQNDIIKASQVLETQINQLNAENSSLKEKIRELQNEHFHLMENENNLTTLTDVKKSLEIDITHLNQQLTEKSTENDNLKEEISKLKSKYQILNEFELAAQINENKTLKQQYDEQNHAIKILLDSKTQLEKLVGDLKSKIESLSNSFESKAQDIEFVENLSLQIKALESEKATLVKEKLHARDVLVELEAKNKTLTDQNAKLSSDVQSFKSQILALSQDILNFENQSKMEKESETNILKCEMMTVQEQFNLLKKEYDDLQVLNSLLKEEVETLKLSLEQPNDDSENLSDLNVSLQADIVKLETKLAAYKQENSSLLNEMKESRIKIKEFNNLTVEYEDIKSKLVSYKSENSELLNEMKEINQVLKERGEAISKLEKANAEMERLIETLEKDREQINEEKTELYKKINTLNSELKLAVQKTNDNSDFNNKLSLERDEALKQLHEQDIVIASLRDDVEKLIKQQHTTSELATEDNMSTSTLSKAEEHTRMKDLDESFEEKYTKLRIFALKLKKKLNETVTQLEHTEQDKAILEKLLNEKTANNLPPINHDAKDRKADSDKIINLQTQVNTLSNALDEAEHLRSEIEKIKVELSTKSQQLTAEIESHKVTKENLEKARRDVKKKNVLSLEMEDYERSMKELTAKMEENKKKIVQMESTIDTQEGTITAMKTQIKLLEEQIKTEETQNRLLKEELHHILEESKEKDSVIITKNGIITKLEQELEDEKRKNEEADVEMTGVLSDKEKIIMSLGEDKAELNNKVKRLEFKCGELNEKLRVLNIELADLKTEYTSYKVRAQAVLRENQTVDHSQEEQLKEEVAALKAQIETLNAKLCKAQEQYAEQSSEIENTRRRATETAAEAARAHQRTSRLQGDLTRLSHQLESERTQHKLQVSTLTQCYKTQISELESKLQKETETLKKQILAIQETTKVGTSIVHDPNQNPYMMPVIPKDENSDGEMDINVSLIPREEGEGSEAAPSPPPSKSYISSGGNNRSPVSLERLLEEGVPDDEAFDTTALSLTSDQEIADLKRRLQAQQQRVKHVTVLLSESERECARMAQLSELLKAELRRVRGTSQNPHNTEYMKNVTLKFLTLPPGDERSRLVPVLQKILTLTPEETQKIQALAKGMDPNSSKGWGSFLPWPGGK